MELQEFYLQNYLVFQPVYKYSKRLLIAILFQSEVIKPPAAFNNSHAPAFNHYIKGKILLSRFKTRLSNIYM